jgi:hypothetical protein
MAEDRFQFQGSASKIFGGENYAKMNYFTGMTSLVFCCRLSFHYCSGLNHHHPPHGL